MMPLIDFLALPDALPSTAPTILCRQDLAGLRALAYAPEGIRATGRQEACLRRLVTVGLAVVDNDGGYNITADGLDTLRANASCRDGCERLKRPEAYWRDRADARAAPKEAPIVLDDSLLTSLLARSRAMVVYTGGPAASAAMTTGGLWRFLRTHAAVLVALGVRVAAVNWNRGGGENGR